MTVKITVSREGSSESFVVPHAEWRAEVARFEDDPDVLQISARQVEPMVHYAYNRSPR